MRSRAFAPLAPIFLGLWLLAGCTTNIERIANTTLPPVPDSTVFDASLDRVWSAAAATIRAEGSIKVLDRTSTTMVSEFSIVDAQELSLLDKALLGKTYSNNYTLTFRSLGPEKTEVSVLVGLQVTQAGIRSRVEGQAHVKSVLRQRLFDRIAVNLGR